MSNGSHERKADGDSVRSSALIMLVEDDELVGEFASTALTGAGYKVIRAATAAEALLLLSAHPDIALVITDVEMPGQMNGVGLAHIISHDRGDLPVIESPGSFLLGARDLPPSATFLQNPILRPT